MKVENVVKALRERYECLGFYGSRRRRSLGLRERLGFGA